MKCNALNDTISLAFLLYMVSIYLVPLRRFTRPSRSIHCARTTWREIHWPRETMRPKDEMYWPREIMRPRDKAKSM